LPFSRPAQRSLALRPAHSLSHLLRPFYIGGLAPVAISQPLVPSVRSLASETYARAWPRIKPGAVSCIRLVESQLLRLLPAGAKVAGWASQPTEKLRLSRRTGSEGYKGGVKRRPRDEWVIQRDTHRALISDAIAETLLANLEAAGTPTQRDRGPKFLLTGLLRTPAGEAWHGNRTAKAEFYRATAATGTRNMAAAKVDAAVIDTMARDLQSTEFVVAAVKATRQKFALTHDGDIAAARKEIIALELRAGRLLDMAAELASPAAILRKVDELERQRTVIEQRIVAWEKDDEATQTLAKITDAQVHKMLGRMAEEVRIYDRAELRDFLGSILDRVELDPTAATLQVCYRIPLRSGNKVASPARFELAYLP